jgi:hypothetical protein
MIDSPHSPTTKRGEAMWGAMNKVVNATKNE